MSPCSKTFVFTYTAMHTQLDRIFRLPCCKLMIYIYIIVRESYKVYAQTSEEYDVLVNWLLFCKITSHQHNSL